MANAYLLAFLDIYILPKFQITSGRYRHVAVHIRSDFIELPHRETMVPAQWPDILPGLSIQVFHNTFPLLYHIHAENQAR